MFNVKKMTVVYNETAGSVIAETTHPSEFLESFQVALENLFPVAEVEVRGRRSHWQNIHSETSFDWNYESLIWSGQKGVTPDDINQAVEEAFQASLKASQDSYADEAYEEYETSRAWLGCPSERFMMGAN